MKPRIGLKPGFDWSLNRAGAKNWTGRAVSDLRLWVNFALPFREATLASGKGVRVSEEKALFRLHLDVADGLMLR